MKTLLLASEGTDNLIVLKKEDLLRCLKTKNNNLIVLKKEDLLPFDTSDFLHVRTSGNLNMHGFFVANITGYKPMLVNDSDGFTALVYVTDEALRLDFEE